MDGAEPGAALAAAFVVGQPVGDAVQIFILPAIVARHALDVRSINHGGFLVNKAGRLPAIHVFTAREGVAAPAQAWAL